MNHDHENEISTMSKISPREREGEEGGTRRRPPCHGLITHRLVKNNTQANLTKDNPNHNRTILSASPPTTMLIAIAIAIVAAPSPHICTPLRTHHHAQPQRRRLRIRCEAVAVGEGGEGRGIVALGGWSRD
ncbi:hypothetical protein KC19_1G092600 [Ceratodon purpureus]|uniref:Uncharacterized protein n=1 Tax=Ceratodon purpureus TaxID=3225 RepID=A0A8T0J6C3_CERPU|nr:hypothetical protein KC19_1G092600 [Ceratodon purpureus]